MANRGQRAKQIRLFLGLTVAVLFLSFAVGYLFPSLRLPSLFIEKSSAENNAAQISNTSQNNQQPPLTANSSLPNSPPNTSTTELKPRPPMPEISIPRGLSGEAAIKALGNNVAGVAAFYRKTEQELVDMLRNDHSAHLDANGYIYYVEPVSTKTKEHDHSSAAQQLSSEPIAQAQNTVPVTNPPIDQLFTLHSKPGLTKVIYIDVDGFDASATVWNNTNTPLVAKGYDNDGNPNSLSDAEKAEIYYIWMLIADAYAPFNVDVTTEDPGTEALKRSDSSDTAFGTRVVISRDETIRNRLCDLTCIGYAYTGVFDQVSATDKYEPVWVFSDQPFEMHGLEIANYLAGTAIHELGHSFGLSHDGIINGTEYYEGHNNWLPIMGGTVFGDVLEQFSKGEYANANNHEDDLAIIAANVGVGYSADDFGNTLGTATMNASSLSPPNGLNYSGIIEHSGDSDFVSFNVNTTAPVRIKVWPGYALHADVTLFDSVGNSLASSQAKYLFSIGTIAQTLLPGVYTLRVKGVGSGNPLTDGYSDYGSISKYTVQIIDTSTLVTPTPAPTTTPVPTITPAPTATATNTPSPVPIVDTDGDGTPDSIDTDDDNDKVLDVNDAFPLNPAESADSDNDGIGNNADPDDDNDGVLDVDDAYPLSSNLGGFKGKSASDNLGNSVAFIGDVNNDNYGDYIVGAHLHDVLTATTQRDAGSAYIVSGLTGQTLFTFNGDTAKDYFGFSVAGVGDVDGDSIPDVAVGAYLDDAVVNGVTLTDAGSVKVFSGATGNLIYQVWGASSKEYFGYAIAGIHDVDGDGKGDIAVGAPLTDVMNNTTLKLMKDAGKIQIFVGAVGTLYRTYFGDAAGDNLGKAVAYAGDINHDNFGDVIAGAPLGDVMNTTTLKLMKDAGYARVYSPNTDTVLDLSPILKGSVAGDNFGSSVAAAGDVNNDGTDDVIVGAFKADVTTSVLVRDAGSATIFSGVNGGVINRFIGTTASEFFGSGVTGVGDINGDGFADVAVGAYGFDAPVINSTKKLKDAGRAVLYSGQTGAQLFSITSDAASDFLGWFVTSGDINNDGKNELFVSAPKDDVKNGTLTVKDAGSIMVISGSYMVP